MKFTQKVKVEKKEYSPHRRKVRGRKNRERVKEQNRIENERLQKAAKLRKSKI